MGIPGFYSGYHGGNAGTAAHPIGSGPIDYLGNIVPSNQPTYIARMNYNSPMAGAPQGPGIPVYYVNPNYVAPSTGGTGGTGGAGNVTPAPTATQFHIVFDTIGQPIIRSIGHCLLPLRVIWAQGINWPDPNTSIASPTLTFAGAICAPIDPDEAGSVTLLLNGNDVIYNPDQGGIIIPEGWNSEDAAALQYSLQNAVLYPGDEEQLPAPLIVADKGADVTNAFRGIRYIILPLFPLKLGFNNLSFGYTRTNPITSPNPSAGAGDAAVEFAAGAG